MIKLNSPILPFQKSVEFKLRTKKLDIQNIDSGYVRFTSENSESDTLWIVSSHVDIPQNSFAQTRVFSHLTGDKIFLNCPQNQWYQNGVPGLGKNLKNTISALKNWLKGQNYQRVICVGHSMGAYMAVVLGEHLDVDVIISTSPELILGVDHSRSHTNKVMARKKWANILDNCAPSPQRKNHKKRIYFGAYDPIDAYFLALPEVYEQNTCEIYEVPHHHGVTEYFTGQSVYLDILENFDGAKTEKLLQKGVICPPNTLGTRQQYQRFYDTYVRYNIRENIPSDLTEYADWDNAGWQHLRAKIYQRNNKKALAHESFMRAFFLAPMNSTFIISAIHSALLVEDLQSIKFFQKILLLHFKFHAWSEDLLIKIKEMIRKFAPPARTNGSRPSLEISCLSGQGMPKIVESICQHYQFASALQDKPDAILNISAISHYDQEEPTPTPTENIANTYAVFIARHPVAIVLSEYADAIANLDISSEINLTTFANSERIQKLGAYRKHLCERFKSIAPQNVEFVRYEKFKQVPKFAFRDIATFLSTNDRGFPHPDLEAYNLSNTYTATDKGLLLSVQSKKNDSLEAVTKLIPKEDVFTLLHHYRNDIEFLRQVSTLKVAHWLNCSLDEFLTM